MVFVVLGMHKSGTTLISEILHKSGINMVENYDPDKAYPRNVIERESTLKLNYKLLNSEDVYSLDVIKNANSIQFTPEIQAEMQGAVAECQDKYEVWGFKDPRTCITYELWNQYLPAHKIIMVYRHPIQVVNYYNRRTNNFFKQWSRIYRAVKNWKIYNRLLLEVKQTTNYPLLLINYQDLLDSGNILEALSQFIERPAYDARLKKSSKRKSKSQSTLRFFDALSRGNSMRLYGELEKAKFNGQTTSQKEVYS